MVPLYPRDFARDFTVYEMDDARAWFSRFVRNPGDGVAGAAARAAAHLRHDALSRRCAPLLLGGQRDALLAMQALVKSAAVRLA
jgi:hypothetical protein